MNKTTNEIREELCSHNNEYTRIVEEINYSGTEIDLTTLEKFALGHIDLPESTVKAIYEELRALSISTGHGAPRREEDIRKEQLQKEDKTFLAQILQETSDKDGIRMERIEQIVEDNTRARRIVDKAVKDKLLLDLPYGMTFGQEITKRPHYRITQDGLRWLSKKI